MRFYLLNLFAARVGACVAGDLLAFAFASTVTWLVMQPPIGPHVYVTACSIGALVVVTALYYCDAYAFDVLGSARRTLQSVLSAMGMAFAAAVLVYFFVTTPDGVMGTLAHLAAAYFPAVVGTRFAFHAISSRVQQRIIVIGTGELARAIALAAGACRHLGTEVVGFLSDRSDEEGARIGGLPVLGHIHEVEKAIERYEIDRVVVASKDRADYFPEEELLLAKLHGTRVESGVEFYERLTGRVFLRDLRASYLIFSHGFRAGPVYATAKRTLDLVGAALGLLLAAPVLALSALAIKLDSPGPVFYRQQRVGRGGECFASLKLRTMRVDAESEGPVWASADDDRITRTGQFLRRSRLDEVPQLWNVLRGDMSFVGPRPERPEFVRALAERYPYFPLRSSVKPGLTGWAQIRQGYVNEIDAFEEKLALDLYYMKYRSFGMDLMILWRTVKTVVLLEGI